ncbi:hypothetical protein GCM10027589_26570 [Actinocorallia lasiicapitis]
MIRTPTRALALITPLALVFALSAGSPAQAAPKSFTDQAKTAIAKTAGAYKFTSAKTIKDKSKLDSSQVQIEDTDFRSGESLISVSREVGAVRPVTETAAARRAVGLRKVKRAGVGVKNAVLTDTADEWGPGLLILSWTERDGVNYYVTARDSVDAAGLEKIAAALPADSTKVSSKARKAIKKAKRERAAEAEQRGSGNKIVDGSGAYNDDFGDESDLCNGCGYSHSNYVGMWQLIMWADGKMGSNQKDCWFGSTTQNAVKSWQSSKGLSADGYIGSGTRGKADNYIQSWDGNTVKYAGTSVPVYFYRSGYYYWGTSATSSARINYTSATLSGC